MGERSENLSHQSVAVETALCLGNVERRLKNRGDDARDPCALPHCLKGDANWQQISTQPITANAVVTVPQPDQPIPIRKAAAATTLRQVASTESIVPRLDLSGLISARNHLPHDRCTSVRIVRAPKLFHTNAKVIAAHFGQSDKHRQLLQRG